MRDLFLYHPGTGTVISLSDPVYLIENLPMDDAGDTCDFFIAYEPDQAEAERKGFRIDNHNMTNLFFDGE